MSLRASSPAVLAGYRHLVKLAQRFEDPVIGHFIRHTARMEIQVNKYSTLDNHTSASIADLYHHIGVTRRALVYLHECTQAGTAPPAVDHTSHPVDLGTLDLSTGADCLRYLQEHAHGRVGFLRDVLDEIRRSEDEEFRSMLVEDCRPKRYRMQFPETRSRFPVHPALLPEEMLRRPSFAKHRSTMMYHAREHTAALHRSLALLSLAREPFQSVTLAVPSSRSGLLLFRGRTLPSNLAVRQGRLTTGRQIILQLASTRERLSGQEAQLADSTPRPGKPARHPQAATDTGLTWDPYFGTDRRNHMHAGLAPPASVSVSADALRAAYAPVNHQPGVDSLSGSTDAPVAEEPAGAATAPDLLNVFRAAAGALEPGDQSIEQLHSSMMQLALSRGQIDLTDTPAMVTPMSEAFHPGLSLSLWTMRLSLAKQVRRVSTVPKKIKRPKAASADADPVDGGDATPATASGQRRRTSVIGDSLAVGTGIQSTRFSQTPENSRNLGLRRRTLPKSLRARLIAEFGTYSSPAGDASRGC
ncbi:hypothetical protein H696_03967 [Fonticula alba]|uniref:Uncharacterized protein n=1 Tax=Fonticula alba TaxID=691883 RepID=A0A058Z621_FONAL|nr:hypothetical protein H696_03967 [Fonticula alba]KCV69546.1 hypothetical protein H696_03967 [Fonticula alba]|eukprot:XP_009496111.1 hypothetical protein H696_03967 [Fonticula alba]